VSTITGVTFDAQHIFFSWAPNFNANFNANLENDNKGMYHASIIDSYLIDFYIPFLPLEKMHVRNCIKAEIGKYKFVEEESYHRLHLERDIDNIADEMDYEPQGYNKFSSSGCKRIPSLVRNLIADKQYKLKDEF
jgi:hypothetical protein